jgi:DNA polymerase I
VRNPDCKGCKLHKTCHHVCVEGTPASHTEDKKDIFILGEAPGKEEDAQGVPFIGRTGQSTRNVLRQMGLLDRVFLDNSVRCRPPDNATPGLPLIRACQYWKDEVARLKPKYLVLMGGTAIKALTGNRSANIAQYRDRKQWVEEIHGHKVKVIATYHPAYALRNPSMWSSIVDDLYRIEEDEKKDGSFMRKEDVSVTILPKVGRTKLPKRLALDIETNGLNPFVSGARILTVAWSNGLYKATATQDVEGFIDALRRQSKDTTIIGHNIKFDLLWLARVGGYHHSGQVLDTMSLAHLLDENRPSYSLLYLSSVYTGAGDYDEGMKDKRGDLANQPILEVLKYNGKDAGVTWMLYQRLWKQIKEEKLETLASFSGDVTQSLVEVELNGIPISRHKLQALQRECFHRCQKIEQEFTHCNISSPAQLAEYFYCKHRLKVLKRTPSGNPSTDVETLEKLRYFTDGPLLQDIDRVLEYRKYSKMGSTYIKNLKEKMDADARVHPSYRQTKTKTGRLSCSEPNFQNLPRDKDGPKKVVRADRMSNRVLVQADYRQIEMRIGAIMSQDPAMLEMLKQGVDLHTETARRLLGREPSGEDRQRAKTINFGIFYGMGPDHLSKATGMARGEAQRFIREWFSLYPGVRRWVEEIQSQILDLGYVESMFGRKRRLPTFVVTAQDQARAIRQAVNHPVQSSASDLNLMAMVQLQRLVPKDQALLIGTVHDSLVWEASKEHVQILVDRIRNVMENPTRLTRGFGFKVSFPVPTPVEIEVGESLGSLKPWE